MILRRAEIEDIEAVLELHARYQVASINEEDKKDGFVTTAFSRSDLSALISQEQGLFIAVVDEKVVAYVMAASWDYWSAWPMFQFMIKDLPNMTLSGKQLNTKNSYQYGPICIDKSVRGTGVLEKIFAYALKEMSARYPILVTFVNKINPRSFQAHKRKLGLEVIKEFEFNNNEYYAMGCLSS